MQYTCIVLLSVACLALPYFSILSHKRLDFWEKVIEHKVCFDFLYNFCLKHVSLRRIQQDIISNVHLSLYKVPVIFVKLNLLTDFPKNFKYQIS
jgi:hypothetical protein